MGRQLVIEGSKAARQTSQLGSSHTCYKTLSHAQMMCHCCQSHDMLMVEVCLTTTLNNTN
jgi:hypothetical protein